MNINNDKGERNVNSGRLDKDDLLKKFDTDELIKYLNSMIDIEIKKSNGMDSNMIDECVDWILELKRVKIALSEEEIKRRVNSITKKRHPPKKRQFRLRYVAAVSAVIIIMIFSVQIVAVVAFEFDLFDWTKNTFLTLIGVEIQKDDKHFTASGAREYNTVEEFEKAENIDITIPNWLPDYIEIKYLLYSYGYAEKQIDIYY